MTAKKPDDKKNHFERYTSLNERTKTNVLHVSLNFDSSEKIDNEKMKEIAKAYMEKIGFGDQPYLVYRHYDSGHPHVHIVSTNIRSDGSRISMHNLGQNQSEKARKEIEEEFGLVKAEKKRLDESIKLQPISAQKVKLGKSSTKRAISNVLSVVINQYKYASFEELNAVLKLYNVVAEKGEKGSVMYEKGGLVFRVLNDKGEKISPPIKASSFWMKPTLKNLEKKFGENESLKQPNAKRLRASIDYALLKKQGKGTDAFIASLNRENISVVLRQNKQGVIYGLTYVDHRTKTVFNGIDLGKAYSARQVLEKLNAQNEVLAAVLNKKAEEIIAPAKPSIEETANKVDLPDLKALEELAKPQNTVDYVAHQLKKKRKKKRKRLKL